MRLQTDPRLPLTNDWNALRARLVEIFRDLTLQLNQVTEGAIYAHHNAMTGPPTTGRYLQGDYIKNKSPSEQGTAGSKYVVKGWVCVADGEPGTWVQDRALTGN